MIRCGIIMYKVIAFIIVGVCFVITHVNCEIFSAIEKLEQLFDSERVFIKELEKFAEKVDDEFINR